MCLAVDAEVEALDHILLSPEPYAQSGSGESVNWTVADSIYHLHGPSSLSGMVDVGHYCCHTPR